MEDVIGPAVDRLDSADDLAIENACVALHARPALRDVRCMLRCPAEGEYPEAGKKHVGDLAGFF